MLDVLLSLLYPPRCALCRRDLARPRPSALCRRCAAALEPVPEPCLRCAEPRAAPLCRRCRDAPPAFAAARSFLVYRADDPRCAVRAAIARWKYAGDLVLGQALVGRFAAWAGAQAAEVDCVVPVPLHRSRLAARGFHQSALLARAVASVHRRPVVLALARPRLEGSQTALGRGARRGNVQGRFTVPRPQAIAGHSVLLVDDVLTTGATADECARTLLAAAAARVVVWTLARAGERFFDVRRPLPSPLQGDSFNLV
jgi:ComF family protein